MACHAAPHGLHRIALNDHVQIAGAARKVRHLEAFGLEPGYTHQRSARLQRDSSALVWVPRSGSDESRGYWYCKDSLLGWSRKVPAPACAAHARTFAPRLTQPPPPSSMCLCDAGPRSGFRVLTAATVRLLIAVRSPMVAGTFIGWWQRPKAATRLAWRLMRPACIRKCWLVPGFGGAKRAHGADQKRQE